MSNLKNYNLTPELLARKFEYEGEMLTLQQIIDKHRGFTNFVTWAFNCQLKGYADARYEVEIAGRAKAALSNQRSKGGRVGRTWKRKEKSIQNPDN